MKKCLFYLLSLFVLLGLTTIRGDTKGSLPDLSTETQLFIRTHFSDRKVHRVYRKPEYRNNVYQILFSDGSKLEFHKNGSWAGIKSKKGAIPGSLLPPPIKNYVTGRYPGIPLVEVEWDHRFYQVELANGTELTFHRPCKGK